MVVACRCENLLNEQRLVTEHIALMKNLILLSPQIRLLLLNIILELLQTVAVELLTDILSQGSDFSIHNSVNAENVYGFY